MAIKIVHLYPDEMNLYGDGGNIICLKKRLEARNFRVDVIGVGIGDRIPNFDIMFIGGGQDREMKLICKDIRRKSEELTYYINSGKTLLAICGGYQILGEYYKTLNSQMIELTGALPFFTECAKQRMIGNIVFESPFGKIVGFENHGGRTYIGNHTPLGRVVYGYGNDEKSGVEGVVYKNVVATYLHGPLLPKNPALCDYILTNAIKRKNPDFKGLGGLEDTLEDMANQYIVNRFKK